MRHFLLVSAAIIGLAGTGAAYAEGTGTTAGTRIEQPAAGAYHSYNRLGSAFTGSIAGQFSAEDLIGRDIVDANGDDVGEVSDLMVEGDRVTHAMVDIGGFLGIGARTVALDLASLTPEQGDNEDLVVGLTRDQLQALPAYEESSDGGWQLDTDD